MWMIIYKYLKNIEWIQNILNIDKFKFYLNLNLLNVNSELWAWIILRYIYKILKFRNLEIS